MGRLNFVINGYLRDGCGPNGIGEQQSILDLQNYARLVSSIFESVYLKKEELQRRLLPTLKHCDGVRR
jgi:hypothetical protein